MRLGWGVDTCGAGVCSVLKRRVSWLMLHVHQLLFQSSSHAVPSTVGKVPRQSSSPTTPQ
jgi:hypothetical protein